MYCLSLIVPSLFLNALLSQCGNGNQMASPTSIIFVQAFAEISDALRADRYLAPHFRYYIREVRVMAYSQVSNRSTACRRATTSAPFKQELGYCHMPRLFDPGLICSSSNPTSRSRCNQWLLHLECRRISLMRSWRTSSWLADCLPRLTKSQAS